MDKRIPLIEYFLGLALLFFLCLQDDNNKLSIHGPQSCSNDMQESKKYELQSLNSQTTIDAFPSITDGVHRNENFEEIIPVFSTFSNFKKKKKL